MRILASIVAVALAASVVHAAPTVAELRKQRAETAEHVYTQAFALVKSGRGTVEGVYAWSVRWLDGERERAADAKARTKALADHAARMADLETWAATANSAGVLGSVDTEAAKYFRIEADLWVATGKH